MFNSLIYIGYDDENEFNTFELFDSCFTKKIITPYRSPSLGRTKGNVSNALAMMAVLKNYETMERNVSLNLAHYYSWLYEEGYYVNKKFIKSQLDVLDAGMHWKMSKKYYHNIIIYLTEKSLLPHLD